MASDTVSATPALNEKTQSVHLALAEQLWDDLTRQEQSIAEAVAQVITSWLDTSPNPDADARRVAYLRDLVNRSTISEYLPHERRAPHQTSGRVAEDTPRTP